MTYIPADPLLTVATFRAACRPSATQWEGLPPETAFLESGRVALWAALRALGLGRGDRLAVPAYICDSILPAAVALDVEVRFVPTDRRLRLDLEAVERELRDGARALLAVHYFGFPAADLEEIRRQCDQNGAALVEDCAHGLYSQVGQEPLGSTADAAIFSPWKTLPLPDGGALVLNGRAAPRDLEWLTGPTTIETARRLAYRSIGVIETALGHSPRLWLLRSWGLRRRMQARAAEAALTPRLASRLSRAIVRGTDWRAIVVRRRANYARLAAALNGVGWATALCTELSDGCCPLGFPILVEERERVRGALLGAGINVRAYWEQLPATVSRKAFREAHYVADRILVLPVHQSLTPAQMSYVVRTLERIGRT